MAAGGSLGDAGLSQHGVGGHDGDDGRPHRAGVVRVAVVVPDEAAQHVRVVVGAHTDLDRPAQHLKRKEEEAADDKEAMGGCSVAS